MPFVMTSQKMTRAAKSQRTDETRSPTKRIKIERKRGKSGTKRRYEALQKTKKVIKVGEKTKKAQDQSRQKML